MVRYGYKSLRRCMPKWRHCLTEKAVSKYIRGEMSMEKNRIKPTKSGRNLCEIETAASYLLLGRLNF